RAVYESLFNWAWGVKGDGGASGVDDEWVDSRRLPVDLDRYYQLLQNANQGEGSYETDKQNMVRAVIDYIASMTEAELDDMYVRLSSGGHLPSGAGHRLD